MAQSLFIHAVFEKHAMHVWRQRDPWTVESKEGQTPAVSFQKQDDFLVETKRNKHILAGYNAAYRLHLNFTNTTINNSNAVAIDPAAGRPLPTL